ncbi:hypothetical protein AB833_32510 [Chromatiales bacterium (ex Bugula neritina AB1)]|nr:hypothetical protein AB833_32510 [Chromatiales bacterium (ex Bugula neritina AB1)]
MALNFSFSSSAGKRRIVNLRNECQRLNKDKRNEDKRNKIKKNRDEKASQMGVFSVAARLQSISLEISKM